MKRSQQTADPPTVDRMRADISEGRTGEKVNFPDPAAAPMGTDEEAAGTAPTLRERAIEDRQRPNPGPAPYPPNGPIFFYFAIIAVLAVAVLAFAMLAR